MGKHKKEHREHKKKKHRSRSRSPLEKDKRKHHKKHHKDKKKKKEKRLSRSSSSSGDEVIYVSPEPSPKIKVEPKSPPPAPPPPPKISASAPSPPRISAPTPKFSAASTPKIPAPPPPKLSAPLPPKPPTPAPPKLSAPSPSKPPTPAPPKLSTPSRVKQPASVPPPPKLSSSPPPVPPPPPTLKSSHSPSPPPPPSPGGGGDSSISIEETNALRAKLGLKPLALKTETQEDGAIKVAGEKEFFHKPAENITAKKQAEKLRNRLAERREKRELEKKLKTIKTLGEDSDDEDASSWIKKSRRMEEERRKAEQKAKELDEMDDLFGIGDLVKEEIKIEKSVAYTAANLKGLTVEHDVTSLVEGKDIILTLKDKDVLAEDTDALINVNLLDDEKYKKNIELKKQKPYNYSAVDSGEMEEESTTGVLSKYDEEIEGAKKSKFTIGSDVAEVIKESVKQKLKQKANMTLVTLNTSAPKIASEYYSRDEMVKFNKPKKKRKIKSRMLKADDLAALVDQSASGSTAFNGSAVKKEEIKEEPMDIDEVTPMVYENERIDEDDDTELQLALKKAMRLKQTAPEKLAARLPKVEEVLEEIEEEMPMNDEGPGGTIVLNSTAEFCRTLGDIPTYGLAGNREEGPSVILDFERENKDKKKLEVMDTRSGGWNDVEMDVKMPEVKTTEVPILDAEPDLGAGVAGALRLAVSKGYLEKETSASRPSASRFSYLQAQNYSIDDKAHQGEEEKVGRRERYCGPTSDFKEKDGYKPNIKLEYIDDDGHVLSAKEAFRYLSHKFHGKGPGKNKVEKRMKKNEQEGLMKQMSSTDTPLGTLQMLQHKQKETHSPFVVLSGAKQTNIPASISKIKK